MSKRFKESSERSDEGTGSRSLLSRLNLQDLKSIKVAICRHNVPEPTSPVTVQRALEDPNELVIHRREGEGQHPIFDRRGIVVNVEKHLEERIVLKSPVRTTAEEGSSKRSHSKTYSDREPSVESYRSRSPRNRRGYSRSPSTSSRNDPKRKPELSKEYGKGPKTSPGRSKHKASHQKDEYRDKRHAEGSTSAKRSHRSVTPNYKRSEADRYDSRSYVSPKERYYREKSPKPGPSKSSREGERYSKERRDTESYRKDKYKGSPKRVDYRDTSPKRYENRSRSPRSPKKLTYKHTDKEKYVRLRTSPSAHPKRYSVSPPRKRQSRSPYTRTHSPPSREVRGVRDSSAKIRKRSASPYERDRDYPSNSGHHSGHSRPTYPKKRSRSPLYRKHSRSPHRTDSGYKYRKRSRSPFRRDAEGYYRGRSRSPARKPSKHSKSEERSYHEPSTSDKNEYRGFPADFDYYGTEGFWIPGSIPRPTFIPRGVIPPMAIRSMMRPGPSYVMPRPFIPMPPHPLHFRPRFPINYNRPFRPRIAPPSVTTSSTNTATTTIAAQLTSAVTTTISTASTSTSSNPIIEEPVSESENVESTVQDKM